MIGRYFVSIYTDGPATRWNVIDRHTQEIAYRFADKTHAMDCAELMNDRYEDLLRYEEMDEDPEATQADHQIDHRKHDR